MKSVKVLVSNDLCFDQRVRKTCEVLEESGLEIELIGRKLSSSPAIERTYKTTRFGLVFQSGALFYAALNLRMFFYLLPRKIDMIWANDLDTLLPAYLVSRIKGCRLVYDSHEYFTEAAGLTGRRFQKGVWLSIEKFIFPKLKHVITVNESIASIYRKAYGVPVHVMRNTPQLNTVVETSMVDNFKHPLLILQGAFMDKDRGVIETLHAMQELTECHLLLIGAGEEWELAHTLVDDLHIADRVTILPRQPYNVLAQYTRMADVGLSLDKGMHFNYYYSLPNKIFDYMHAGTPVVASPLPEVKYVIETSQIGEVVTSWEPQDIAYAVRRILRKGKSHYAEKLELASKRYNWEEESKVIGEILLKADS
ncbi:MAG: glycosyltransferase [Cryomorphaceae bacterium]|nr:glycosyltransferase [Cryomorphaceae bacterium]